MSDVTTGPTLAVEADLHGRRDPARGAQARHGRARRQLRASRLPRKRWPCRTSITIASSLRCATAAPTRPARTADYHIIRLASGRTMGWTRRSRTRSAHRGPLVGNGHAAAVPAGVSTNRRLEREEMLDDRIELHGGWPLPLACMLLALAGIPLGITTRRAGKSAAVVLTVVIAFIYYMGLISCISLARQGSARPEIARVASGYRFRGVRRGHDRASGNSRRPRSGRLRSPGFFRSHQRARRNGARGSARARPDRAAGLAVRASRCCRR